MRLRDVETADLEAFLAYEHDPEAVRRSRFPPREREAFMAHWTSKVLGDPANLVQTVVVDGGTAGNIVAWWEGERRYIGYWLGRPYWGRGIGTRALTAFLELETARPLYADPAAGNAYWYACWRGAGSWRRARCCTGRTSMWCWCSAGVPERPPCRAIVVAKVVAPGGPCRRGPVQAPGCWSGLAMQMLLSYSR